MHIFKYILNKKWLPGNHTREKGILMEYLYSEEKNKKTQQNLLT